MTTPTAPKKALELKPIPATIKFPVDPERKEKTCPVKGRPEKSYYAAAA